MNGALSGVKVLDFTEYIAGPYCGQMLADMGADVTKIEPLWGDFWRLSNPIAPSESRGFISLNKGKKSASIDMKRPEAREILTRALQAADVMICNYRPGVAQRLGIDYDAVHSINPRLVYGEITGFGTEGPYAGRAAYDLVAQATTGIMAYEGGAGLPRPIATMPVSDLAAGMFLAFSVSSALFQRTVTGVGQHVETNLFAAGIALQYRPIFSIEATDRAERDKLVADLAAAREQGLSYEEAMSGKAVGRTASAVGPYYRTYEARDGYFVIACLNNRLRRATSVVVGVEDPRVVTDEWDINALDREAADLLTTHMEAIISTRTVAEWCADLDMAGVPCGPVKLPAEVYEDPHVVHNDLVRSFEHPIVGTIKMPNSPLKMSGADTGSHDASPALGQHTRPFLAGLGFDAAQIEALEHEGVVKAWQPPS